MRAGGIKIIIAAGGTGGHVFTGVAVAEELRSLYPDAHIAFAGTRMGLEEKILPGLGWRLVLTESAKLKGKGIVGKFAAVVGMPLLVLRAALILRSERPRLFISIGGYASGPLGLAAWLLRIPIVLVEPNAIPGMTNRILGRFARIVFTAFDEATSYFKRAKVIRSGVPVRKEVLNSRRNGEAPGDRLTIFVFGGSQGARRLNEAVRDASRELGGVKEKIRILHQTGGSADTPSIEKAYADAGISSDVFDFTDRIWKCYEEADFVIARSGAATVAELLALAIPSVLVPYPYAADDHQRANAKALVRLGGALMIDDSECTGHALSSIIKDMLGHPEKLAGMKRALASAEVRDAARRVVNVSMGLVGYV